MGGDTLIVLLNTSQGIDWNATGVSRRLQNINNALNTFQYEVAYDRTFGRDPANQDKPMDKYLQAIIPETYEVVPKIDSGARVLDVDYEILDEGGVALKVVIELD